MDFLKEYQTFLGLSVLAAVITTIGSLIALFLKDFLFVRYFDSLKEKRVLKSLFKKYNDPLVLSAMELSRRLHEVLTNQKTFVDVFTTANFHLSPKSQLSNDANDPYFLKYKIVSTLYRFCCVLGWLELYRQEMTFLESHSTKRTIKLLNIIETIRTALADGQLISGKKDWMKWKDILVFREELRAIGEGMIENNKEKRTIMGYGKFQEIAEQFPATDKPVWLRPATNFFMDFDTSQDFRLDRLKLLINGLLDLVEFLNKDLYKEQSSKLRVK